MTFRSRPRSKGDEGKVFEVFFILCDYAKYIAGHIIGDMIGHKLVAEPWLEHVSKISNGFTPDENWATGPWLPGRFLRLSLSMAVLDRPSHVVLVGNDVMGQASLSKKTTSN